METDHSYFSSTICFSTKLEKNGSLCGFCSFTEHAQCLGGFTTTSTLQYKIKLDCAHFFIIEHKRGFFSIYFFLSFVIYRVPSPSCTILKKKKMQNYLYLRGAHVWLCMQIWHSYKNLNPPPQKKSPWRRIQLFEKKKKCVCTVNTIQHVNLTNTILSTFRCGGEMFRIIIEVHQASSNLQ